MHRVYTALRPDGSKERFIELWASIPSRTILEEVRISRPVVQPISMMFIYLLSAVQDHLPLNPARLSGVNPYLSFNTAASFMTNTNWQVVRRRVDDELSQPDARPDFSELLVGGRRHVGAVALIRGFTVREPENVGNFWRDTVRGVIYILLPLAIVCHLPHGSRGCPDAWAH